MANSPFDPSEQLDNPYLAQTLVRRTQAQQAQNEHVAAAAVDPYADNWGAQTVRSVAASTAADVPAIEGLVRKISGDQAGAEDAIDRYRALEEKAQVLGPEVQTLDDVHGVGDAAQWAGFKLAGLAPDIALAIGTDGVGTAAVEGVAQAGARGLARRAIERQAARSGVESVAGSAAERAAATGAAEAASERVAAAQAREAAAEATGSRVDALANRFVRESAGTQRAIKAGGMLGAGAGMFPSMNKANADLIESKDTDSNDALKLAAGTYAASVAGALPVGHFLSKFGGGVEEAIVKSAAEKYMPRLLKETGVHAAGGAAAGVASAALERATHKWVDDNVDMLSPEAFDQYLEAAGGGALLGGGFGAVGVTGQHTLGKVAEGLRSFSGDNFKQRVSSFRSAAKERLEGLSSGINDALKSGRRARNGEEVNTEAPSTGADFFKRAMDTVQGGGDMLRRGYQSASDRMRGAMNQLDEAPIDERVNKLVQRSRDFEAGRTDAMTDLQRSPSSNPVKVKDKIENILLANVPPDHPMWANEAAVSEAGRALGRVFRGDKRTVDDNWTLATLLGDKKSGITRDKLDLWAAHGPDIHETLQAVRKEPAKFEDASEPATIEGEKLAPIDRMNSARRTLETATDPAEIQRAQAEHDAAREEGLHDAVGGKSALWTENRNSDQARTDFADRFNGKFQRSYVALKEKASLSGGAKRTQLLDIASLIERQRAKIRAEGTKATDIPAQQALLRGLGELKQLGVEIDPSNLRRGAIHMIHAEKGADGKTTYKQGRQVGFLSTSDVKALRGELSGTIKRNDAEYSSADGRVDPHDMNANDAIRKTRKGTSRDNTPVTEKLDEADLEHVLGPRGAAPGRRVEDKMAEDNGRFVPDQMADADAHDPYATLIASKRKELDTLKDAGRLTPRHKADMVHAVGYEVGVKELQKQRATGTISERRFAREMAALEDRSTGASKRYFEKARDGKFATASFRELPNETGKIDSNMAAKERDQYGVNEDGESTGTKNYDSPTRDMQEHAVERKLSDEEAKLAKDDVEARGEQLDESDDLGVVFNDEHPNDTGKETEFTNRLLKRMGIDVEVRVEDMDATLSKRAAGSYNRADLRVQLNKNLKGTERLSVMLHEVGHHVVWHEVMKMVGIENIKGVSEGDAIKHFYDAVEQKFPGLSKEIQRDYARWYMENSRGDATKQSVRTARSPLHRALAIIERGDFEGKAPEKYDYAMHEWLADNIAKALEGKKETHDTMSSMGKFFDGLVNILKSAYEKIFSDPSMKQYKAAPSIDKWVQEMFDAKRSAVEEVTGEATTAPHAEAAVEAAAHAATDVLGGNEKSRLDFVRYTMSPKARETLDNVLRRPAIMKRIEAEYAKLGLGREVAKALRDGSAGMENRILMAYDLFKNGTLKLGPEGTEALTGMQKTLHDLLKLTSHDLAAQKVFEDIAAGAIDKLRAADYKAFEEKPGKVNEALRAASGVVSKMAEPLSKVFESKQVRMLSSGVPELRKLASALKKPQDATGEDPGFLPASRMQQHRFMEPVTKTIDSMDEKVRHDALDALKRQINPQHPEWEALSPEAKKGVLALRDMAASWHDYLVDAGVLKAEQKRENYWPVVFDTHNPSARAVLTELYSKPKFEAEIRRVFGDTKAPIEKLVANLVDGAIGTEFDLPSKPDADPKFRGANYRLSDFVYKLGDAEDIKAFAGVQSRNMAEVMARHLEPMVKLGEATRRGLVGKALDAKLAEMKKQGATPAQIAEARDQVAAALGTYAREFSPTLAKLSPDLAKNLSGDKTKAFVESAQAYQNLRLLLPVSILSSIVDPMGIAVRSGGDFKSSWDGFRAGVKTLFDGQSRDYWHGRLKELDAMDDIAPAIAMAEKFSGQEPSLASKVNDFVFKWNGMKAWVRATRVMALKTAHGFLLNHAESPGEHTARYMDELGLRDGDIQRSGNEVRVMTNEEREVASDADIARDDRVRNALATFVNDAVLRPNSQQTPLWHSDPYMGVFNQYKGFSYAIYDQIGGRIGTETKNGNYGALYAGMAYFPIAAMAEMLREFVQYGSEGNPRREQWGPTDYMLLGVSRSGWAVSPTLGAIKDVHEDSQRGEVPGMSLLGPTAQQSKKFFTTRNYGGFVEDALPASTLYKHWDDDVGEEKPKTADANRQGTE
jgi:hypothetical protein